MSDLRQVAQQALEALQGWKDECPAQWTAGDEKTITALRAALEAQEEHDTDCHTQGICQRSGYSIAERKPAYNYAKRLAESMWNKHYKAIAPNWRPLDDLIGVLTQIDNMTGGLASPRREWQGLKNEELYGLLRRTGVTRYFHLNDIVQTDFEMRLEEYSRAIEAALKEKNHG